MVEEEPEREAISSQPKAKSSDDVDVVQVEAKPHRETLPSSETKAALRIDCFSCGGAGHVKDSECIFCEGSGVQPRLWLGSALDEGKADKGNDVGDWV